MQLQLAFGDTLDTSGSLEAAVLCLFGIPRLCLDRRFQQQEATAISENSSNRHLLKTHRNCYRKNVAVSAVVLTKVMTLRPKTSRNFNSLCEISFIRYLNDVAPTSLKVLRKHWRDVFHSKEMNV